MQYKKAIFCGFAAVVMAAVAAGPVVSNVTAKQRFPWNGLVDITCEVSGINGTTNGIEFAVAAVMPDSGNARYVSNFWIVRNGTNSFDKEIHVNGNYRLLWDAQSDLGAVICSNMVVRVTTIKVHGKVQLWRDGPYWATMNIGADKLEEHGWYFWWGDTVGYKFENGVWVASDGSSSDFSFNSVNVPTSGKSISTLESEGWITADGVLAPEHDAAHVQWGGGWRIPTSQELSDLTSKCDWSWTIINGIEGCLVSGKGDYSSSSIFLPAAGYGDGNSLSNVGSDGLYWSSVPTSDYTGFGSWYLRFFSGYLNMNYYYRSSGQAVRPVQGFVQLVTYNKVTYNPGENGTGSQQVDTKVHGVALTLKEAIFTRSGCTQTGWSTSDGGAKAYDLGASYTVDADLALYPFWTAHTYMVTLDRQRGGGGTASVTATYGSAMPSITVPTRTGYTFGGYYTGANGSGTQYYTASGASARTWDKTSAMTLYAKWIANTYMVTLDHQSGGGGSTSVTATYGDEMPSITVPTKAGYTFGGYYTGINGS